MVVLRRGYTLVELVIVIAMLAVLAGIALPRFVKASEVARGTQVLASMYTCEEAINIYHAKNVHFPENTSVLVGTHLAEWPIPPSGKAIISKNDGSELELTINSSSYVYVKPTGTDISDNVGRVKLGGKTIQDLLSTSATSLTLTDD